MDYIKPWHALNINISNAVRSDFNFDNFFNSSKYANGPAGVWNFRDFEIDQLLNTEWINAMHLQGIMVQSAMVFYREPQYIHPEAHIDTRHNGTTCISAINWTLDPKDDSEMVWYYVPQITPRNDVTPADTKYQSWHLADIDPYRFASTTIGTIPTLVRTGIPHNVIMHSRPRWAVSVRYIDQHLDDWPATVDFFKPWIKNVDC
jgi:hypothetical protein